MTIKVQFIEAMTEEWMKEELLNVLTECDQDFFPPLSSRRKGNSVEEKLRLYIKEKQNHHYIVAWDGRKMVGFLNFLSHYQIPELDHFPKSNHADTTCILKEYRKQGIAQKIYKYLEEEIPDDIKLPYITRETWSTNHVQINIYEKLGYQVLFRSVNSRGKGIDSLIYGKKIYEK